jgi:hypothetical protein
MFARHPRALAAAAVGFAALKLFFFFIYPGFYRHSALIFAFYLALAWMAAEEPAGSKGGGGRPRELAAMVGSWLFVLLMMVQTVTLVAQPVQDTASSLPYSRGKDLAERLRQPDLQGSVLMIDPESMGESVGYYLGEPYWLIRQGRFGIFTLFNTSGRKSLTLDDFTADARMLHGRTGRKVVIALAYPLETMEPGRYDVMYKDYTLITPGNRQRFLAQTRKVGSLRPAQTDEEFDLYVYPR